MRPRPYLDLDDPALKTFRAEVAAFIEKSLPEDIRRKVADERMDVPKEDQRRWHRILKAKGWVCPSWPKEHGGPGWDDARQYIFEREIALADAPRQMMYGVQMLGPCIIGYGTPEQQKRFLPRILNADDFWCQGFSEPNAGSDLAAVQTKAVRDGDHYIVNGGKLWTSEGHIADWIFALVRTDPAAPKRQQGISFLLIDLKSPGIEVNPVWTFDGGGREVNQIFFTDVRVPVANRIGKENEGWTVAKHLLSLERFGIAEVSRSLRSLARVRRFASARRTGAGRLIDDPFFARRLTETEIELRAIELTEQRLLFGGDGTVGAEASLLKLRGCEAQNRIIELMFEAIGPEAQLAAGDLETSATCAAGPPEARYAGVAHYNYRKTMIYGGSNEIQRNIMAKAVLGL
jgi:hypothetical protein